MVSCRACSLFGAALSALDEHLKSLHLVISNVDARGFDHLNEFAAVCSTEGRISPSVPISFRLQDSIRHTLSHLVDQSWVLCELRMLQGFREVTFEVLVECIWSVFSLHPRDSWTVPITRNVAEDVLSSVFDLIHVSNRPEVLLTVFIQSLTDSYARVGKHIEKLRVEVLSKEFCVSFH